MNHSYHLQTNNVNVRKRIVVYKFRDVVLKLLLSCN